MPHSRGIVTNASHPMGHRPNHRKKLCHALPRAPSFQPQLHTDPPACMAPTAISQVLMMDSTRVGFAWDELRNMPMVEAPFSAPILGHIFFGKARPAAFTGLALGCAFIPTRGAGEAIPLAIIQVREASKAVFWRQHLAFIAAAENH